MMCEECGKWPATVHITKVVNGQKTERHMCQECAQKQGQFTFMIDPSFTFHNLLAGLFDPGSRERTSVSREPSKCPNCGLTFADFRRLGHLGCDACYDTFSRELEPVIRRIHGSTRHTGKVPLAGGRYKAAHREREIQRLREELQRAVLNEEYEKAAQLRDQIRELSRSAE